MADREKDPQACRALRQTKRIINDEIRKIVASLDNRRDLIGRKRAELNRLYERSEALRKQLVAAQLASAIPGTVGSVLGLSVTSVEVAYELVRQEIDRVQNQVAQLESEAQALQRHHRANWNIVLAKMPGEWMRLIA